MLQGLQVVWMSCCKVYKWSECRDARSTSDLYVMLRGPTSGLNVMLQGLQAVWMSCCTISHAVWMLCRKVYKWPDCCAARSHKWSECHAVGSHEWSECCDARSHKLSVCHFCMQGPTSFWLNVVLTGGMHVSLTLIWDKCFCLKHHDQVSEL